MYGPLIAKYNYENVEGRSLSIFFENIVIFTCRSHKISKNQPLICHYHKLNLLHRKFCIKDRFNIRGQFWQIIIDFLSNKIGSSNPLLPNFLHQEHITFNIILLRQSSTLNALDVSLKQIFIIQISRNVHNVINTKTEIELLTFYKKEFRALPEEKKPDKYLGFRMKFKKKSLIQFYKLVNITI